MILTTTPTIEGRNIRQYNGIVCGEVIAGVNFLKDFGASIRNFIGGRSGSYENELIKAAASGKHIPLNNYVSLEPSLFLADQEVASLGAAYHGQGNPEDVVIHQENLRALEEAIQNQLTQLEAQVLARYLEGASYAEIAEEVNRSTKAVDNAVQRIRRKIARHLSHGDYSKG